MTEPGIVICSNCGFRNAAGDEFCGNCGRYLEFSGTAVPADEQGGSTTPGGSNNGPVEAGARGGSLPDDSPTIVQPVPPIPARPTGTGSPGFSTSGRAPDVICWNCGRRNPAGRAFCMQCGTKLTAAGRADAGYGAGMAGGVAYRRSQEPPTDGGGRRMLAIGAAFIALLLLLGLGIVVLIGALGKPPASGLIAGISPSPPGASASELPSFSPALSPSFGLPTIPASVSVVTPPPPETPNPTRTPRPTCDVNGAPRGCRPSPMPPTMEPTPTVQPTPVNCLASTQADRSVTLTVDFPVRPIPDGFAWCVHDVTFTNTSLAGATGQLKLYLENPEFVGPPSNYGMAKIGWPGPCEAGIETNFGSSAEYHPTCEYPFGYESIPTQTIVSFEIVNCGTNGTCGGSVTIEFERVPVPPAP